MVAVLTTALALRLLGIRRGWITALVSGVIGWGLGALVALSIADWDWGADGVILHTFAIAIPATMATAVTIDLLARPGTLAMGERAGSSPRRDRSARSGCGSRCFAGTASSCGSSGARASARSSPPPVARNARSPTRVCASGSCSKKPAASTSSSGQIAATRVDLVPPEISDELAKLQNRVPPADTEAIREVLETELGDSVERVFAEFDWEPLAAASIGQTHRARLRIR